MHELTDRVVMVTGATGALGGAVVKAFLGAGAAVWGVSATPAPNPIVDPNFTSLPADLATPAGAESAARKVAGSAGRIDALVHLVGGFAGGKPVAETDDETWEHMFRLNVYTAFCTVRAVLPRLLKAGRGRIVAIGSRTGVEPAAGLSAYGASKAALIALIRTVAAETRNSGVTANVVLPSVIDTPANRGASPGSDFSKWVKPEAIANLLLFLAGDAAADMNGAVIPIYGRV